MSDVANIEVTVRLPDSEYRQVKAITFLISDGSTIGDFYIEVVFPMLIACGYSPLSVVEGAQDLYEEMEYLLREHND